MLYGILIVYSTDDDGLLQLLNNRPSLVQSIDSNIIHFYSS